LLITTIKRQDLAANRTWPQLNNKSFTFIEQLYKNCKSWQLVELKKKRKKAVQNKKEN